VAPLIVFEGYKVASLGGASRYLEYVGRKASMVGEVGISKGLAPLRRCYNG
jgi:hypothetical protein